MNKNNILIALVAVVVIAAGAWLLFGAQQKNAETPNAPEAENNSQTSGTQPAGMLAEDNAVVVVEQRPGTSVIAALVKLTAPGYAVIHADNSGQPGAVLGASALLPAGESTNVSINLSRSTRDGEKLHVMLHKETDGNSSFGASVDLPVQSRLGGPISGWFDIAADAPADTPVINY